ncbi:MAG TPA: SpoIIE family protein phosphatase [Bacteroidota bacterium]|nr:SpoIIE family protein phosphatase [Bacteroidota bacterium]
MAAQPFERIRHNVLTEVLTDDQFRAIGEELTEHRFRQGEVILEDEEEGDELFLIAAGRVRISKQDRQGRETILALLHPGDFFGELELIDQRPRAARVTAVDECIAYSIGRKAFERLLKENSTLSYRLLQVLSVRLRTVDTQLVRQLEHQAETSAQEIGRLRRIIEAAKALNSTLDLDRLLAVILETALGLVDGDRGTVYLVDDERKELWSRVFKGGERIEIRLPTGSGIAGYVAATGDTLNIPDAYFDARFNPEIDKVTGYRTRSILCMPMKNRGGTIVGVFQILNKRAGTFSGEDESVLDALSVHAAIAVENARLYEQERQKIAMEKDLQAAREVQMTLIPRRLPDANGYAFAAVTIPAREVGGDLYDFTVKESGQIALCLGDVSGKGLAASLLAANVQATLRDQTLTAAMASECVRRSNMLLFQTTGAEKFVTLFYGVLDPSAGTFTFCNAGHERPFHIRHDGSLARLSAGGTVLGIMEDFSYEQASVTLGKGDVVLIFSDGVTEAMNAAGDQLGEGPIETVLRKHQAEGPEAVKEALVAAVREHAAGAPQADDITIVVVKKV